MNASGQIVGYFFQQGGPNNTFTIRGFLRDQDGNFTIFDVPNSAVPSPRGINNAGVVMGNFDDSSQGGRQRGFVRDSSGNITAFDAPQATNTNPTAMNNSGVIVGGFSISGQASRGFIRIPAE